MPRVRNVVLGRLRPDADPQRLAEALALLRALTVDGRPVGLTGGVDLRLREGGWDFALVADFPDEPAYRAYDRDEEHERIRRELIAPLVTELARVQFALPD